MSCDFRFRKAVVMRKPGIVLAWALCLAAATAQRGDNQHLREHPGKAAVRVERKAMAGAGVAERDTVQRNLERSWNLPLPSPVFYNLLVAEVTGWMNPEAGRS